LWILHGTINALEFNRYLILSGEYWRIWSGHLVHQNMSHFGLNTGTALILYFGFFPTIRASHLLTTYLIFSTLIGIGLLFYLPHLQWYNGLSGLLHALLAYFSALFAVYEKRIYWSVWIIVWLKVLSETFELNIFFQDIYMGLEVINEAHLMGVIIGTTSALIVIVVRHIKQNNNFEAPS
jgi:rhomboid family GlyGly-CTERM serine protease